MERGHGLARGRGQAEGRGLGAWLAQGACPATGRGTGCPGTGGIMGGGRSEVQVGGAMWSVGV